MSSPGWRVVAAMSFVLVVALQGACWAAPAPLLGAALASSLLGGGGLAGNGTSALGLLALAHLQHKLDALGQLADLLALGENVTSSFFV